MIALLKVIHIGTIAIWAAGLISLPGLYVKRVHVTNDDLHRLHGMVRFAYVSIISPAAFLAIGSGIALIFMRETFEPWFSLKLAFVAALVVAHSLSGLVVIRLFDEGEEFPVWRCVLAMILTIAVVVAILALVLAKPVIPLDLLPSALSEPGALHRIVDSVNPWRTP